MPLRHVLRHELRLLLRGRVATTALLLLAIVVAYGAFAGARWRSEQLATVSQINAHDASVYETIAAQLEELRRQGNPRPALQLAGLPWYLAQSGDAIAPAPHVDPRRAEAAASEWVGGRHAILPPAPFSALAVGQSDLHPYYARVTIRTRPALVQSDELENPVNLLTGRFDLAFVLAFCWPVLVLPLLYNVASEERESGTLALVASQPVSWTAMLLVRLSVRVGLAVAVTLAVSVLTLWTSGALAKVSAIDLTTWSGVVMALALFWTGVATLVNAAGWSSAANSGALIVMWLLTAIVIPSLVGEAAHLWAPVPSRVELITAVRQAASLTPSETTTLVSSYYETHPDAERSTDAADTTAIRGLAQQDEVDARIDPILTAYSEAVAQQQAFADGLRFLSPPLLIHDAVTELAGSGAGRYRQFGAQVDQYHRRWRGYFYPLVHARTMLGTPHYDNAPRFTFVDEPAASVRRRTMLLTAVAGVIGLCVLGAGLRSMG
jgi:ABC-2 type transport system permease protein